MVSRKLLQVVLELPGLVDEKLLGILVLNIAPLVQRHPEELHHALLRVADTGVHRVPRQYVLALDREAVEAPTHAGHDPSDLQFRVFQVGRARQDRLFGRKHRNLGNDPALFICVRLVTDGLQRLGGRYFRLDVGFALLVVVGADIPSLHFFSLRLGVRLHLELGKQACRQQAGIEAHLPRRVGDSRLEQGARLAVKVAIVHLHGRGVRPEVGCIFAVAVVVCHVSLDGLSFGVNRSSAGTEAQRHPAPANLASAGDFADG